jgi:hypothetical protein
VILRDLAIEELVGGVKLVMKTKPIAQHNNTSFNLQFGFSFSLINLYLKNSTSKNFYVVGREAYGGIYLL